MNRFDKICEDEAKKTTLANLRNYKGRFNLYEDDSALIDRRTGTGPTGLGNPHVVGKYNFYLKRKLTREDAVTMFRETFAKRMQNYPTFAAKVEALKGKRLFCWCTPLACHGDVYIEYLENGPWW